MHWDLLDAFRAAAEQAGIKAVTDFNTGDNEGCCAFHVNQKRGRRWSAAAAFLKPVLNRANLRLETGCLVEAVSRSTAAARPVYVGGRMAKRARRKCAAKSFSPPARLARRRSCSCPASGRRGMLQQHGINVVADRPGVGANLQDHLQLRLIYKVDGINTLNERYHAPLGLPRMLPNMRCSGAVR